MGAETVAVIVVARDRTVGVELEAVLSAADWRVDVSGDPAEAIEVLRGGRHRLAIVHASDSGDPRVLLRSIRESSAIPVLMLVGEPAQVADCLEAGADDCAVWPLGDRELVARARLRAVDDHGILRVADLTIDTRTREAWVSDRPVELTVKEFELLVRLVEAAGTPLTREQLLRDVWGSTSEWQDPSTVTEHVHRLRGKIEVDPSRPELVRTVRGVGYRVGGGRPAPS